MVKSDNYQPRPKPDEQHWKNVDCHQAACFFYSETTARSISSIASIKEVTATPSPSQVAFGSQRVAFNVVQSGLSSYFTSAVDHRLRRHKPVKSNVKQNRTRLAPIFFCLVFFFFRFCPARCSFVLLLPLSSFFLRCYISLNKTKRQRPYAIIPFLFYISNCSSTLSISFADANGYADLHLSLYVFDIYTVFEHYISHASFIVASINNRTTKPLLIENNLLNWFKMKRIHDVIIH